MTILFLARRFYPLIGGAEKHVMEISKRLVGMGHRVIVVTESLGNGVIKSKVIRSSSHKNELEDFRLEDLKTKKDGIEIIRIPAGKDDWFKKFRIWKSLWGLRDLINQADVIHCHDVFFWYMPFRILNPLKSVYTTFHGYESYPIRKGAVIVRKISEKLSMGNICIGDFIKKWYGTAPTFVSYGAVEISDFRFQISDMGKAVSSGIRHQTSDIKKYSALFFGRLDEQTGILTYVKAFEILKKKFPKFELLVVGEGKYKDKIGKKVKTIGFQKNPEKYFEKYHFAFVSRYLSILEAFAVKRPVIAVYDNPVKEDYLRMAPYAKWIIIEKEPEAIAKRVEDLLANPEKEKQMVESAYKWAQKQSWEEIVKIYSKLWK